MYPIYPIINDFPKVCIVYGDAWRQSYPYILFEGCCGPLNGVDRRKFKTLQARFTKRHADVHVSSYGPTRGLFRESLRDHMALLRVSSTTLSKPNSRPSVGIESSIRLRPHPYDVVCTRRRLLPYTAANSKPRQILWHPGAADEQLSRSTVQFPVY